MAILFSLCTVVSTFCGGFFALRRSDRLHLILGFTAGVLLGLVAFDLLPEVFALAHGAEVFGVPSVMLTFAAGFLFLHVVERTVALHGGHELEYGDHHHPGIGLTSAIALATHSFLDGVAIGLGFHAGKAIGIAIGIAVISHDFADGINTVAVMTRHGNDRRRSMGMLVIDALAPALGALSTLWLSLPDSVLSLYLGFFAGFVLYLATGDILPEAHSRHPSRLTLLCTLGGSALMAGVVAIS